MESESQIEDCNANFDCAKEEEEVNNNQNNVGEKHSESIFKRTVYCTIGVYSSVFCLGLVGSLIGPSLLDLQELYQIPTSSALILVSCCNAGYLTGTLLGGYTFSKLNDTFYFLLGSSGMAVTLSVVLWIPYYPIVCAITLLRGIFQGFVQVASHVYIMATWRTNRHLKSLTMVTSVAWSSGSFLAPIILEPFLSEDDQDLTKACANVTNGCVPLDGRGTKIRYGWLTISLICCMAVALNGTSFCWGRMQFKKRKMATENAKKITKQTNVFRFLVSSFAFTLYFFYMCVEQSLASLMTAYVVKGLLWEKYKGPLITSVFWGLFGLSQLVAVFVTRIVKPAKIILTHFAFVSIALLVLSLTAHLSETVVWVCVTVLGYSAGPFFHCGFLLINKHQPIDGCLSATILCASFISSMINVPLLGYILTSYGPSAMTFTLLGFAVATIVTLCLMTWLTRRYKTKERLKMSAVEVPEERVELNRSA